MVNPRQLIIDVLSAHVNDTDYGAVEGAFDLGLTGQQENLWRKITYEATGKITLATDQLNQTADNDARETPAEKQFEDIVEAAKLRRQMLRNQEFGRKASGIAANA